MSYLILSQRDPRVNEEPSKHTHNLFLRFLYLKVSFMLCFLSRLVSSPVQKWKRSTSEAGEPISRLPWLARIRRTPLVCAGTSTVTPLTTWRGRVSTPGDFPTSMSFGALLFEGLFYN